MMKNILIYIFILFIGCLIGIYINSHKSTKYKENININKIKNNIQPYINEKSIQIDNFNKKNLLDNNLKFRSMTLPDNFIDQDTPDNMYKIANLDSNSIEEKVLDVLNSNIVLQKQK